MIETLLHPLSFGFVKSALLITVMIAVPMALLSCYLVVKGWSLMGDAVSHAVLPGVVLSYMLSIPIIIGAFAAGLFCALAAGYLRQNSRIKEDTVLGVVFSSMFALGLVMYVNIQTEVHLDHILFGNMLGVTRFDLIQTALIAVAATLFILIWRKDLLLNAFDGQHARAIGLPVGFLNFGLLAVLSLTIVGALKAVGIILAIALLIAPGAIAYLITSTFRHMLIVSVVVATVSSLCGIYLSTFINSDPAATIVLLMTVIFIAAFLFTLRRNSIETNSEDQQPA